MKGYQRNWLSLTTLLALAVPATLLWAATPEASRGTGLVLRPFGWPELLAAHLLAGLPLALFLAGWLRRHRTPMLPSVEVTACLLLAALVGWATLSWGNEVGRALRQGEASFAARVAARVGWCLLLQLPWCLMGRCLGGQPRPTLPLPGWVAGALAAVVAVALPAVYVRSLSQDRTREIEEQMGRGRWARAQWLTVGLDEVTPPSSLARVVSDLEAAAARPLPMGAPTEAVVGRAGVLAALDRLDEARRLVMPLADADPGAELLLARIDHDLGRWADSTRRYRAVLRGLDEVPSSDRVKLWRVEAYDGLAFNAREQADYAGAVAVYEEALASIPGAEAYFHFQLGRQLHQAGRSTEALKHLEVVAQLDPKVYAARAAPLVANIRAQTMACLIRHPK